MNRRPPDPNLDAPAPRAGFWRRLRRGLWKAQRAPIAAVGERVEPMKGNPSPPLTETEKGDLDGL